ncbi:MAG: hypothetical protein GF401_17865 [Chitinivibrionales bacterium]|nr:hypothetical protein [Chitinivibrionales bacterium]
MAYFMGKKRVFGYFLIALSLTSINATCEKTRTQDRAEMSDSENATGHTPPSQCNSRLTNIAFCDSMDPPRIILENGMLRVTIYTPNSRCGYYRGTRFDWSGMIAKVEYNGHSFFSEWKTPHDPSDPGHGIGPAEEFDMETPPLFSAVDSGDTFVKIGVGKLIKTTNKYFMNTSYPVAEQGLWQIRCEGNKWIEFKQDLTMASGWGYSYIKQIYLSQDTPAVTISHTLHNIGNRKITTEHYSHNFITIDEYPVDSMYRCRFPFVLKVSEKIQRKMEGYAVISDSVLNITGNLGGKALWAEFEDLAHVPEENQCIVTNRLSGASITVEGTKPPSKYNFYAEKTAVCPEPFVKFSVSPDESVHWETRLTFKTNEL